VLETVKVVFWFVELLAIQKHFIIQTSWLSVGLIDSEQWVSENLVSVDVKCHGDP
jgi:hypothetical protein